MNLVGGVAILFTSILTSFAQDIHFYDHHYYGNYFYSSRITTSCETLPLRFWNKVASIKTSKCIILFSHPSCTGTSFRLNAGNYPRLPHFTDNTDSFRACDDVSELSPYRDFRIHFYDLTNYRQLLLNTPIIPGCQNLPRWAWNDVASIWTDTCVLVYSYPNCQAEYTRIERGGKPNLRFLHDDIDSFRPCDDNSLRKDYRLTVQIVKMDLQDLSTSPSGTMDMAMGATQSFRNNGSATISQRYSIRKDVKETVQMSRFIGTSDYHRFYVDVGVNFQFSAGIPFFAQTKIGASLKTGYEFQRSRTESTATFYKSETSKRFEIDQNVQIPPCTVYEISSTVKLRTNYPVKYTATAYVTGEYSGKRISAKEVRSRLASDMTYIRDRDSYTVEAKFERTLTVDFGLTTSAHADGHKIDGCNA